MAATRAGANSTSAEDQLGNSSARPGRRTTVANAVSEIRPSCRRFAAQSKEAARAILIMPQTRGSAVLPSRLGSRLATVWSESSTGRVRPRRKPGGNPRNPRTETSGPLAWHEACPRANPALHERSLQSTAGVPQPRPVFLPFVSVCWCFPSFPPFDCVFFSRSVRSVARSR